jgi:predicted nuclease of predicted toxin-antitoxin system
MLFIFDENFPPEFVRGFAIIEKANKRSPFPVDIAFSPDLMGKQGSPDEEIIAKAAKKNAVIVTQDTDFKRIKHYKSLLVQHNVGYVYFKVPGAKNHYWDIVKAFVVKWEELKEAISKSTHPFAFEINKHGAITKLSF